MLYIFNVCKPWFRTLLLFPVPKIKNVGVLLVYFMFCWCYRMCSMVTLITWSEKRTSPMIQLTSKACLNLFAQSRKMACVISLYWLEFWFVCSVFLFALFFSNLKKWSWDERMSFQKITRSFSVSLLFVTSELTVQFFHKWISDMKLLVFQWQLYYEGHSAYHHEANQLSVK